MKYYRLELDISIDSSKGKEDIEDKVNEFYAELEKLGNLYINRQYIEEQRT